MIAGGCGARGHKGNSSAVIPALQESLEAAEMTLLHLTGQAHQLCAVPHIPAVASVPGPAGPPHPESPPKTLVPPRLQHNLSAAGLTTSHHLDQEHSGLSGAILAFEDHRSFICPFPRTRQAKASSPLASPASPSHSKLLPSSISRAPLKSKRSKPIKGNRSSNPAAP